MRLFRMWAAGLLSAMCATGAAAQTASRLSAQLEAELAASAAADVFVLLRDMPHEAGADLQARRRAVHSLCAQVLAPLRSADIVVHREFRITTAFTATATRAAVEQLLADPRVVGVEAMKYGSGGLADSVPQVRADAVHRRGDLGQGVTVAVLDTGVDASTPDVADSIAGEHCFCTGNCCPDGTSEQDGTGSAHTQAVHGNHVTGIIVSKGQIAPAGVAPGAAVVAVKVLNDRNRGFLTDWIAGLEWIATNRPEVRAINMSLVSDAGYSGNCDTSDSFNQAFAQVIGMLRARGTLTFVATGNTGHTNAIASPACVTGAIAVGAVQKGDVVWAGSNSDADVDVLAPGVGIVSTGLGNGLATLTGTSMATPHVTGSAALLLALNPALDADSVEAALTRSTVHIVDGRNGLTFPRLNSFAAMQAVLDQTRPLLGGGSARRDCLVEWNVGAAVRTTRAPICGAVCRDNDPTCDADTTPGQCTFLVSACFNVTDPRLPGCTIDMPIVSYHVAGPRRHDQGDAANAAALAAALPPLPLTAAGACTADFSHVVPAGTARWIRLNVSAADGRRDYDRLRFTCEP